MNFLRLFHDLEELIVQFVMLFVLAPKTLARVLRHPRSLPEFVAGELKKPVEQRYDAQVSPVLFWILFCVLPAIVGVHVVRTMWETAFEGFISAFAHRDAKYPDPWAIDLSPATISYGIILAIWLPLAFAIVPVLAKRVPVTRSTLYGSFLLQCYVFGGATTGFMLLNLLCAFTLPSWLSAPVLREAAVSPVALLLTGWWFVAFQSRLFRDELSTSRKIALALIAAAFVFAISVIACTYWLLGKLPPMFHS
ncbi:MAG: hypothetical protein QOC70_2782 [Verrucomicrobiota bacterium]|jgi:hypothetical protein